MPRYYLKVTPGTGDRYCEWWTNPDGPTFDGTRIELREHARMWTPEVTDAQFNNRMDTADMTGSCDPRGFGSFNDMGFLVAGRWFLPRARLRDYLDKHAAGKEDHEIDFLEDFEDEDED